MNVGPVASSPGPDVVNICTASQLRGSTADGVSEPALLLNTYSVVPAVLVLDA